MGKPLKHGRRYSSALVNRGRSAAWGGIMGTELRLVDFDQGVGGLQQGEVGAAGDVDARVRGVRWGGVVSNLAADPGGV